MQSFRQVIRLKQLFKPLLRGFSTTTPKAGHGGQDGAKVLLLDYFKKAGLVAILAIEDAGTIVSNYSPLNEIPKDTTRLLSHAIESSKVEEFQAGEKYVHRPVVEKTVLNALEGAPNGVYHIVYGVKGVGKTEVVDRMAIGCEAVVKFDVGNCRSRDALSEELAKQLLGEGEEAATTTFKI